MLAQYLVSIGVTNLQTSKKKSAMAVNTSQVNKKSAFHANLLVESFWIVSKNTFYDKASGSALLLICS